MKKKIFVSVAAAVLAVCCVVGGTMAWLTAETDPVVNTFTVGDINIDLTETTTDYHILPGTEISKDPKVTVTAGSEACYLFVKVEQSDNWLADMTYKPDEGWIKLEGVEGVNNVYYRVVDEKTAKTGAAYDVLAGSETYPNGVVNVSSDLTKEEIDALKDSEGKIAEPTLTFTAYAVQQHGSTNAAEAWAKVPQK